jgi:hypothetical protein
MTGQMTALLIGDEPFRTLVTERALSSLGILAALAATAGDAATVAGAFDGDIHVVLVRLPDACADPESVLKPVLAFADTAALPVLTVGDNDPGLAAAALRAGALHHVPVDAPPALMEAAIAAGTRLSSRWRRLETERRARANAIGLLTVGSFHFRTPTEAGNLAVALSAAGASPQRLALGLLELMLNAVEHGNLGIGFAEKSRLRASGRFGQEVEDRLARPENLDKWATVDVMHDENGRLTFVIADEGRGFDWTNPPGAAPDAGPVLHGRGILLARSLGFDEVRYQGCGNRVVAIAERAAPPTHA